MIETRKKVYSKLPIFTYDTIFKSIFINNPNILGKIIFNITGIPYIKIENNIILETNELPINKINEKALVCDFLVNIDKSIIINIELNRHTYSGLLVKNLSYIFKIYSSKITKGKRYDNNMKIIQLNINCFNEQTSKPLSEYFLMEKNDKKIYTDNLIVYSLNIVKCQELYYNNNNLKLPNYIRWGALINCHNIKEIDIIGENILTSKERNIIMEELNKFSLKDLFMTEEEALRLAEWERNTIIHDAKEEGLNQGIQEGIKQGIEQEKKNIIISMLNKGIDKKSISEITGKTIEEIEKISK